MLDFFFLAFLENRICLIHFFDESVESSFKDGYNSFPYFLLVLV